jgi:cysteinyl-tRNA synthetase
MLDRLYGAVQGIEVPADVRAAVDVPDTLIAALEDDLNSPKAMSVFFGLAKDLNKATDIETKVQLAAQMYACGDLMGLLGDDPDAWFAGHVEGELTSEEIDVLVEKRNVAKSTGDYTAADAVRDELKELGITIQDSREGTTWRRS